MRWFLGLDGGGTQTRVLVCDATGTQAGSGAAGGTNPHHTRAEGIARSFTAAIRAACAPLHLEPGEITAGFLGVAGVTDDAARAQVERLARAAGLAHARLGVDHDIRIALAGGLEGRPGVALVVGTGSSCYGRDAAGRTWQTGGWEALIGDEGSGYFLGREALRLAVRMADGRTVATALRARVFGWLGIQDVATILRRLGQPAITKPEVARLAPLVVELAEGGDSAARAILEEGARALAELVVANHRSLPTGTGPEVVVTGGLGTAAGMYRRMIYAAIERELPQARVGPPALAPVAGAVLLAMERAGVVPTPACLAHLRMHPIS